MFETPAFAATAGAAPEAAPAFMVQIFPLILIFIIFYFLLIRPQQQRVKQHQAMVGGGEAARHGDHQWRPDRQGHQGRRA